MPTDTPTPELVPITLVLVDTDLLPISLLVEPSTRDRIVEHFAGEDESTLTGRHYMDSVERAFAVPVSGVAYIY